MSGSARGGKTSQESLEKLVVEMVAKHMGEVWSRLKVIEHALKVRCTSTVTEKQVKSWVKDAMKQL